MGVVLTPLLVRHLGPADYGALETLTSLAAWLALVQVGVSPSLLNSLSGLDHQDPDANALFSTAFFSQVAFAITLILATGLALATVDIAGALNFPQSGVENGSITIFIVVTALAIQLPTSLARTSFFALQHGYLGTTWEMVGSLMALAAVGGAVLLGGGLPSVAGARTFAGPIIGAIALVHLFRRWPQLRPRLIAATRKSARGLWSEGSQFTLLAIASLVITSTDNIVISRIEGPAAVAPYAVAWKLTQFGVLGVMAILDAAWPAYRDALRHREYSWLRATHRRLYALTFGLLVGWSLVLTIAGERLAQVWVGPAASPDRTLLLLMTVVMLLQGAVLSTGRLVTALGAVKSNARIGLANAAINLPLSIVLGHRMGVTGVALGTAIGYALTGWRLFPVARRELRRHEQEA